MTIKEREAEIVRVKEASFAPGLTAELQAQLRKDIVTTVQATLEEALVEEVDAHLVQLGVDTTAVNQARYSCTSW